MSRTKREILYFNYTQFRTNGRDKKPWYKPPKWYKIMKNKIRRAKQKDAIVKNNEIPIFRKTNDRDWT